MIHNIWKAQTCKW